MDEEIYVEKGKKNGLDMLVILSGREINKGFERLLQCFYLESNVYEEETRYIYFKKHYNLNLQKITDQQQHGPTNKPQSIALKVAFLLPKD